jgi:hypothetical protein
MRALTTAVLILTLAATTLSAQTAIPQPPAGRTKIWLGVGLLTAGAFILPITSNEPVRSPRLETGVGLMTGGGVLLFWGFQETRKGRQPQKAIGVTLGRSHGVHVRVAW